MAWYTGAENARRALIGAHVPGTDVTLEESIYQASKPFVLGISRDKCAYCESPITATHPGDVEHYRPKGRIRDSDGKIAPHPGYWWLAYQWENLLPSCIDCNRRRSHGDEREMAGKADYFVIRGQRAYEPDDDLDLEQPELLDPTEPEFVTEEHLEFLPSGEVKPRSARGEHTCKLLGLNVREALKGERERAYTEAQLALAEFFAAVNFAARQPELARAILAKPHQKVSDIWNRKTPYTATARAAMRDYRQRVQTLTGSGFELPLPALA